MGIKKGRYCLPCFERQPQNASSSGFVAHRLPNGALVLCTDAIVDLIVSLRKEVEELQNKLERQEMSVHKKILKNIPKGWSIAYFRGIVIAVHPNHTSRTAYISSALVTPFDKWEELKLHES